MNRITKLSLVAAAALVSSMGLAAGAGAAKGDAPPKMGFFVTSAGPGNGADLGGSYAFGGRHRTGARDARRTAAGNACG